MTDTAMIVLVIVISFIGILPLLTLFITSTIEMIDSGKECKRIRKEITELIDRM